MEQTTTFFNTVYNTFSCFVFLRLFQYRNYTYSWTW